MSDDGKILPYRGAERARCPNCGKPAAARFRPFCSKRCADLDLHKWLSEGYRVATDERPAVSEDSEQKTEDG